MHKFSFDFDKKSVRKGIALQSEKRRNVVNGTASCEAMYKKGKGRMSIKTCLDA